MRSKLQLRMQTLMVLVIVPALLVVIAGYGWSNYQAVYQVIIDGFNRKLQAISTTSASFVDGDAHDRLVVPRDIQAIAFDQTRTRIVGVDRGNGFLVALDPESGSADELMPLGTANAAERLVRSMTYDEKSDRYVGLLDDRRSVIAIDPEKGTSAPLLALASPAGAIGYSPKFDALFLAGDELVKIPADKSTPHVLGRLGLSDLQGLVWDAAPEEFIALESASGFVFRFNPNNARLRFVGPLVQDGNDEPINLNEGEESKQWVEPQLVKLPAYGLALNPEGLALFATTDRLLRVSIETGKADPTNFRAGFRSDTSTLYAKYAAPMTRIMTERGLTYHYSTTLPRENQIVYVLDGTEGEDHSPAGTEEEVDPAEWQRLDKVLLSGQPSQSDIKQFDIWGLLKVGSAVITNSRGEGVGLVGADVDISTINAKTRVALLEVFLVGALSLILAAVMSVWVSRRLLQPLERLKEAALQVAAGNYTRSLRIFRPKEVSQLAQAFDRVRSTLRERMETLEEKSKWFESHRRTHELMKLFSRGIGRDDDAPTNGVSAKFVGEVLNCRRASGWISCGDSLLVWIGQAQLEPFEAVRLRSDIATILRRIVSRRGPHWDRLKPELEPLFRNQVSVFMLLDGTEKAVYSLARERETGTIITPRNETKICLLFDHPKLVVEPGHQFVFSTRDDAELQASIKAE